jgi:uncharacterized membrane protein
MQTAIEFLKTSTAQGVLWGTVLIVLGLVAWYFLSNLRDRARAVDQPSDHLSYFREMHGQGVLSETEYRKIKANLNVHLRKDTPGSSR